MILWVCVCACVYEKSVLVDSNNFTRTHKCYVLCWFADFHVEIPFYLNIATGLLEISIIKSIIAITDREFGNIFDTMWSTLYRNCRYISYTTQINNQLLFKIRVFGSPRCSSLKSMLGKNSQFLICIKNYSHKSEMMILEKTWARGSFFANFHTLQIKKFFFIINDSIIFFYDHLFWNPIGKYLKWFIIRIAYDFFIFDSTILVATAVDILHKLSNVWHFISISNCMALQCTQMTRIAH